MLNGIAGLITAIAALVGAVSTPFTVVYLLNRAGRERAAATQSAIEQMTPPAVAITEAIIEASEDDRD